MRALWITVGLCVIAAGCFSDLKRAHHDAGADSGPDAEHPEAGDDSGSDDAGMDAPIDAPDVRMELLSVMCAGSSAASGRIVDDTGALDCGGDCDETYALGTTVTLTAHNTDGSDTTFAGWTGSCAEFGLQRTCTLEMNAPRNVTARFEPLEHNLVFITSEPYASNLGVAMYDQICNERASYIGVNNLAGDGFIAWIGTSDNLPSARLDDLVDARGFVRIDGRAFSDRISDLTGPSPKIWNPVAFNELGIHPVDLWDYQVMTGLLGDGTISSWTCNEWTSLSYDLVTTIGSALEGPAWWAHTGVSRCDQPNRLICLQRTFNNPITTLPQPASGSIKRLFLSKQVFVPGGGIAAADGLCNSVGEKPDGVGTYKAWLSTTTTRASDLLEDDVLYVSPDLQPIATGAALNAVQDLQTGIWQHGDRSFSSAAEYAWTGANRPTDLGTENTTCDNWTSNSSTASAIHGRALSSQGLIYWEWLLLEPCSVATRHLYCVEQ